jgi:hypothetical protein
MLFLQRSDTREHCNYKGGASRCGVLQLRISTRVRLGSDCLVECKVGREGEVQKLKNAVAQVLGRFSLPSCTLREESNAAVLAGIESILGFFY